MVKGETKSGIKFQLNPKVKEDTRLLFYLTKLHSEDTEEQNEALFSVLKLIFGGENGLITFMDAVASVHEGVCSPSCLMEELNEMFEALDLKN